MMWKILWVFPFLVVTCLSAPAVDNGLYLNVNRGGRISGGHNFLDEITS